ncbi:unnamed protein product [Meganyctiphanes norvegica]|uniref:Uncharacterized protein n=1 Tax=Meganyctiphanes norvegica TaxID=48144 RepID=A0AAV2R6F0_MEGNR
MSAFRRNKATMVLMARKFIKEYLKGSVTKKEVDIREEMNEPGSAGAMSKMRMLLKLQKMIVDTEPVQAKHSLRGAAEVKVVHVKKVSKIRNVFDNHHGG